MIEVLWHLSILWVYNFLSPGGAVDMVAPSCRYGIAGVLVRPVMCIIPRSFQRETASWHHLKIGKLIDDDGSQSNIPCRRYCC